MDKRTKKIFTFSLFIAGLVIPILDIISMNSGVFGNSVAYTLGMFGVDWWSLFFKFNLISIVLVAFAYYFFYRQDFSESVSLVAGTLILWFVSGISDFMFFFLQGYIPPQSLPWLNNAIIGKFSQLLGFAAVTSTSLLITMTLGIFISYHTIKFLVRKF